MAKDRMNQINELIKQEVAREIFSFFPDEIISVTQVSVSRDLAHARIWISSTKNIDEAVKKCNHSSKEMRKELAERIIIRRMPELYFVPDKTEEEADKLEKIFKEIKDSK